MNPIYSLTHSGHICVSIHFYCHMDFEKYFNPFMPCSFVTSSKSRKYGRAPRKRNPLRGMAAFGD